jgi:hypothetical protein
MIYLSYRSLPQRTSTIRRSQRYSNASLKLDALLRARRFNILTGACLIEFDGSVFLFKLDDSSEQGESSYELSSVTNSEGCLNNS